VFIVVLDQFACRREWVAAEFAAAYRNKIVKGTPEIFIIHPKEIDFAKLDSPAGSFFAELIVQPSRVIPERMLSRMAPYDAQSSAKICSAIRSYPIAGTFGGPANLVIALITGLLVSVLGLACNLGLPLLLAYVLARGGIISPASLLGVFPEIVMPVAIALALTGGFSLRCALRSFAEIRRSNYSYVPGYLELIETVAFFVWLSFCVPWLSLNGMCLIALMVFFGLELGSTFTVCTRTWKSQSE
jgi:hypothetical protein